MWQVWCVEVARARPCVGLGEEGAAAALSALLPRALLTQRPRRPALLYYQQSAARPSMCAAGMPVIVHLRSHRFFPRLG